MNGKELIMPRILVDEEHDEMENSVLGMQLDMTEE